MSIILPEALVLDVVDDSEESLVRQRLRSQCQTCRNPNRNWINQARIRGTSIGDIHAALQNMEHEGRAIPSKASIGNHFRFKHLEIKEIARIRLIEEEGKRQGVDSAVEDVIATGRLGYKTVLQIGMEQIQDGALQITPAMYMKAVEIDLKSGDDELNQEISADYYRLAVRRIMEIMASNLTKDQFESVARHFQSDALLDHYVNKAEGNPTREIALPGPS